VLSSEELIVAKFSGVRRLLAAVGAWELIGHGAEKTPGGSFMAVRLEFLRGSKVCRRVNGGTGRG
jgi:hypothetical protein